MRIMRKLAVMLAFAGIAAASFSQGVTTAAMNGRVLDAQGQPLPGATIMAVHNPTGTTYGTTTRLDGGFNLANVQTGGPYTLSVSFIGYRTEELTGIRLSLGEDRNFAFTLVEDHVALEEVLVTAMTDRTFNSGRSGTATNIDAEAIESVPTISRSINDLTRLTPQSSGTSFAGRDNRFNNYTIDGIIYNNNFGLGTAQFAGANPLSLEAIEEVQVNLAPYDVRQGGFSGANVNAITRRGGNQYRGSVYTYYNDESYLGTQIGDIELTAAEAFTRILGASVSGPIIRDRLFFFVSVEQEAASNPGLQKVAARPGLEPDGLTVSRVPASELDFVREQMKNLYDYNTGPYEGYDFGNEGLRLNARIDFNINRNNNLMVRFNRYEAFRDITVNGNSLRYNPSALRYRNTNRFGIEAMNFRNSHYTVDNNVTSIVGELNTIISANMANNFRIGFNMVEDPIRNVPGGQVFPFIEVLEFDGDTPLYYMTMGNELFTVGNQLANNVFNVTNNFSYYAGRHNFTFGMNFEYMTFANAFNPVLNGLYRFNSYENFVDAIINQDPTVRPDLFLQGYSFKGPDDIPLDETAFGQFGIYAQDRFEVNDRLNLTFGLRIDFPFYPIDLPSNPNLDAMNLTFTNPRTDETIVPDVSVLPPALPLWSPRFGFNYDVFGDRSLQVRGGTGMFSGRVPFVWISNQVNNNGVTRGGYGLTADQWGVGDNPQWQGFQPDVTYYRPDPATLEAQVSRNLAITDENFKLPQVWRTNLAADIALPYELVATVEGIYSLDINSPLAANINTTAPTGRLNNPYPYPYWESSDAYYDNNAFTDVILLTNINEGYYASITGELSRSFGEYGNARVAYTRSVSKDYGLIGGSQAASLWPDVVVDDRNNPEIGFSRFDQPNRLIAHFSLNTRALGNRLNTNVSIIYDGGERGRYSYTYSGRFNDGAARLMYIPNSLQDSYLVDRVEGGVVTQTAAQQWAILDEFISQDPYLSANRGSVAERNGAKFPWQHRFDLRVAQDFMLQAGANRYKLQAYLDVLNFGNLINSEWGVGETNVQNNLMNFQGVDASGNGIFTINTIPGTDEFPTTTYRPIYALSQTWSAQIGLRLSFN
ncbi:MAG: cell envelope biogenesis protein OmpA [Marinilabiliales bacterium]|nr:MAG: cell envelope biogenesis protein OmpA [Marinilabiliales bacterium]